MRSHHCPSARPSFLSLMLALLAASLMAACGGHPAEVSPAEIPQLAQRVQQEPNNGPLQLRYAAALYAANRCDTAVTVARTGMALAPGDAVGPLVVGRCLEAGGQPAQAVQVYRAFVAAHPDVRGAGAVQAQELLAERAAATQAARSALQRESTLASQPGNPQTVAVLPLAITGDSTYDPLSRGLAQMLTSDLALLNRFKMVERLEIGALLNEMHLSQTGRVDPSTAARVGHLVQAGRLVEGVAAIPNKGDVHLEASVVQSSGAVTSPEATSGRLRDLLKMEKTIVVGLAGKLGYTLSEAERKAILENGTQDLSAFLAYSRGLVAEDAGDYSAAATYFGQAVQRDPGFSAARTRYQASAAAPAVQQASAGQVTQVARQSTPQAPSTGEQPLGGAVGSTIGDLAPTQAEQATTIVQTTQQAVSTTTSAPPPQNVTPPATVTGIIRIIFRLP